MAHDDRQAAAHDRRTVRAGEQHVVLRKGPTLDLCEFFEISLALGGRRTHPARRHGDRLLGRAAVPAIHGAGRGAIRRRAARRRHARTALARLSGRARTFRDDHRGAAMTMLGPFERLLGALTDPARRERSVAWLLV